MNLKKGVLLLGLSSLLVPQVIAAKINNEPGYTKQCVKNTRYIKAIKNNVMPEQTGEITAATDNAGNPVKVAYKTKGLNDGRPVVVFIDPYFGINGWDTQQKIFSWKNYTIALDLPGFGLSTKNEPTDMDGVMGHAGYSFRQWAALVHKTLEELNINGPIIWSGVDYGAQIGMWYAKDYANDTHTITKMMFEASGTESIVSDDPCSMAWTNSTNAAGIAAFYSFDPVAATSAFLGDTFKTTDCPEIEQELLTKSVSYITQTPSSVFTRLLTQTLTEDMSGMMKDITVPVINIYGDIADTIPIARNAEGVLFTGRQIGRTNPLIGGTCTANGPFIEPFPKGALNTYKGHATVMHVTACQRFNRDLWRFIEGTDSKCSVCDPA